MHLGKTLGDVHNSVDNSHKREKPMQEFPSNLPNLGSRQTHGQRNLGRMPRWVVYGDSEPAEPWK